MTKISNQGVDTIGKGPGMLSTCVKRWRFLHAKLAFCYKIVRNSVHPAFFGKQSMQSSIRTVLHNLTKATNFNAAA